MLVIVKKKNVLIGFKLFMLLCYKYTSTTSAYWIQTDSISVNVTYDMIFFECLVIGTLVVISAANGFYLPGLAPVNYCREKEVTKNCKVAWSYYLIDFWCTCRTGVICDEWECSRKMTVSIIKKVILTSSPLCVFHLLRPFFDDFQDCVLHCSDFH